MTIIEDIKDSSIGFKIWAIIMIIIAIIGIVGCFILGTFVEGLFGTILFIALVFLFIIMGLDAENPTFIY